jgi:hypothetical protein
MEEYTTRVVAGPLSVIGRELLAGFVFSDCFLLGSSSTDS